MKSICYRHEREVSFSDTDASGRVHFTKFLAYAEEAEHAYLHKIGIPVFDETKGGWPRVRIACDYRRPLRFGDRVEIMLRLAEIGGSSLKWDFEIAGADGGLAASGEMVTVRVNPAGQPEAITEVERKRLEGGL